MKKQKRIKIYIGLISISAAILITLLIIHIFPFNRDSYTINKLPDSGWHGWYTDFDCDGQKEIFFLDEDEKLDHTGLYVYKNEATLLGQFNFKYTIAKTKRKFQVYPVDINSDGVKELILFTQHEDSVFLNVFDYQKQEIAMNKQFISTIGRRNGDFDYEIDTIAFTDVNNDSWKEFYFYISAGFSLHPRRIYRYDFLENTFIHSINTGAKFSSARIVNKEDQFLLLATSAATGNIRPENPVLYHDTTSWIFRFDRNLNFAFPPLSRGKYPSIAPKIHTMSENILLSMSDHHPEGQINKLYKTDLKGNLTDSLEMDKQLTVPRFFQLIKPDEEIHFIANIYINNCFVISLEPFSLIEEDKLSFLENKRIYIQEDINGNQEIDYLMGNSVTKDFELYFDGKFKDPIPFNSRTSINRYLTYKYSETDSKGSIMQNTGNGHVIYEYRENRGYKLRYLYWIITFIISLLLINIVLYFQRKVIRNLRYQEQQIASLQIRNIMNQMDPHFTFNILNSVGNAIYQENKEEAYDIFQRFTRMLRTYLTTSQSIFHSLDEEIQFLRDYLELQKKRFKGHFNYEIIIDQGFNLREIQVPRLLFQIFAENAVKHAFVDLREKGRIIVTVNKTQQGIKITIDDNGMGINKSNQLGKSSGTKKGNKMIMDHVQQINKIYDTHIQIQIIDKKSLENHETGTRVSIFLS